MRTRFQALAGLSLAGALLMPSCGLPGSPAKVAGAGQVTTGNAVADAPELPAPTESSVKVTYTDRTVLFDRPTWKRELKEISNDQSTYTFDSGSGQAQKLQPGKTLFLYGRALRKVTRVERAGNQIVALTEAAVLTDLIQDGHISWRHDVDFSKGGFISGNTATARGQSGTIHTPDSPTPNSPNPGSKPSDAPSPGGGDSPPPADATPSPEALANPGSSMALTRPDGSRQTVGYRLAAAPAPEPFALNVDGYKLKTEYHVNPDRVDVTITASKDFGAGTVMVEGKGYIKKFSQRSAVEVRGGAVDSYSQSADGVSAAMTVSWLSKKDTPGAMAQTTILKPQVSYNMPIAPAGIPMFMEVGVNAAAIPGFSSQGSAKASFKVTYNGNEGIEFSRGRVGGADTHSGEFAIEDSSLVSPAIISMTSLITFPKIAIGLGWRQPGLSFSDSVQGVSAAGWVDLLFTMSSITTGLVNAGTGTSCVKTAFSVTGRYGMEFRIFGIDLPNPGAREAWTKKVKKIVPPGSPLCEKVETPAD